MKVRADLTMHLENVGKAPVSDQAAGELISALVPFYEAIRAHQDLSAQLVSVEVYLQELDGDKRVARSRWQRDGERVETEAA